jgi:hypothetical protein
MNQFNLDLVSATVHQICLKGETPYDRQKITVVIHWAFTLACAISVARPKR